MNTSSIRKTVKTETFLGKRLSEHSGKQSKEIRKLKQQLSQLELVTAARDDAMAELQAAQQTILEYGKEVEQLKGFFFRMLEVSKLNRFFNLNE